MSSQLLSRMIWIPCLLATVVMTVLFARQPLPLPTPAALTSFITDDKAMAIQHPGNWKAHGLSLHGISSEVWFEPTKDSKVHISTDLQGSLMADITRSTIAMPALPAGASPDASKLMADFTHASGNASRQPPGGAGNDPNGMLASLAGAMEKRKTPLEMLHESEALLLPKLYPDYKEGATEKATVAGLEALATNFTFRKPGLWTRRTMVGRRYSMLDTDRRIRITYYFPQEQQSSLQPVFKKMLGTLKFGQGGG